MRREKGKKRSKVKRFLLWVLYIHLVIIFLPIVVAVFLIWGADMREPQLVIDVNNYELQSRGDTLLCAESYLYQDSSKIWELYVKGSGQERGAKQGALTEKLLRYQEDVFVDQIRRIVPSDSYLGFLRYCLMLFNRNLGEAVPLEYREEILAISQFCTHDYDAIGTPYERQLNYHAAHDIGHAMQQYMLVGCSSFGVWGESSESGDLLIGRNFDFYLGDDFARNKVITFAEPDKGYRYASVGWAGMVGVLSGMNEKGLTVIINAAKGAIPTSAATPISILAREILQYASNIEQAYVIASEYETFVSESILVGSQQDNKASIIEKTPKHIALYEVEDGDSKIVCTNHFQSSDYANDDYNVENIELSDSKYRFERASELIAQSLPVTEQDVISILRDRYGKEGKDVGIGNEMTLNQSIAHHSVVFNTSSSKMWISTSYWQSGEYVCYDLEGFFKRGELPYRQKELTVPADSLFLERDYPQLMKYRGALQVINSAMDSERDSLSDDFIQEFLTFNPNHYYTYRIMGDYYLDKDKFELAIGSYKRALQMEIPYKSERIEIDEIVRDLIQDLK